jgi:hypothetical protein
LKFSKIVGESDFPYYGIPTIVMFGVNNACEFCSIHVLLRNVNFDALTAATQL